MLNGRMGRWAMIMFFESLVFHAHNLDRYEPTGPLVVHSITRVPKLFFIFIFLKKKQNMG